MKATWQETTAAVNAGARPKQTTLGEAVAGLNAATEKLKTTLGGTPGAPNRERAIAAEVEAELSRPENSGVAALMNETTGKVAAFMAPVAYHVDPVPSTAAEADALEVERQRLSDALPGLDWTDRVRARRRINAIEDVLKQYRARVDRDARKDERQVERKQHRGGWSE